jgi:hypothetical protein
MVDPCSHNAEDIVGSIHSALRTGWEDLFALYCCVIGCQMDSSEAIAVVKFIDRLSGDLSPQTDIYKYPRMLRDELNIRCAWDPNLAPEWQFKQPRGMQK